MIKKTIKYTDYNGIEREEDFYFNLSKAEIAEMELSQNGGLSEYVKSIVEAKNSIAILSTFKQLILKAYGMKTEDGKRFVKSDQLSKEFAQTEAYSELFMELATDEKKASEFINGIIPQINK